MHMCTFVPFSLYLRCMRPATGTVLGVEETLWDGTKDKEPGGRYVQILAHDSVIYIQVSAFL